MLSKTVTFGLLLALVLGGVIYYQSEAEAVAAVKSSVSDKEFSGFWYQGQAELTRYELKQERYGEVHQGDAVLIFVTEDFLDDKQVKYEFGPRGENVKSILKLNATRKFFTGVYPYSIMTSVFTPVEAGKGTYKVATSSQEWCGHTFMQLNQRQDGIDGRFYSYFQAEGDQQFKLPNALMEDEIWTKLRLDPAALPTGSIELVPALHYLRLRHKDAGVLKANAELRTLRDAAISSKELIEYSVRYKDISRSLKIVAENEFPFTILGWEEVSSNSGLITRAAKTNSLMLDYWSRHSVSDSTYRTQLGL